MTVSPAYFALDIGTVAQDVLVDALPQGRAGDVVAVYERCCYVRTSGGLACVGTRLIGAGPLNARIMLTEGQVWNDLNMRPEMKVRRIDDTFVIDADIAINLATAAVWTPPPLPIWSPVSLQHGLEKLMEIAPHLCPDDGLSRLAFAPTRTKSPNPHATAARAQFDMLDRALQASLPSRRFSADAGLAATLLLGLGPGLTPSGDDVLGGVMLALTALDQTEMRDKFWDVLRPELDLLTNEISAMHLAVAADGLGAAIIHEAINALLTGARPDLEAIHAIGHTSGWDTLAGITMTLRAAAA
jgi:hypothetical protein